MTIFGHDSAGNNQMIAEHSRPTSTAPVSANGFTVITTHINADFDALGSLLAAQKLYPGAKVVFPGSQEKNLRNFFIQSMVYLFNLTDIKDIRMPEVKRLVLVDTRRADRIGKLAAILENESLDVHIYDHHPIKTDDIRGQHEVYRLTGATVTILTDIIRERSLLLTPEEATIMCLGIYEDTGSFTFSSTTAGDLEAAAYLVSRGANINIISSLIAREISPEQIGYLNDMIQATTRHLINGIEVVVTRVSYDHYLPDFAFLVHKMVKMEEIDALFALAMMENKVYIVARSRTEDVDTGEILGALGGGGHPSAASAVVKGETLAQVEQSLFKELNRHIQARRQARHLMASPAISVRTEVSCSEANALLTRYNINALLVVNGAPPHRIMGYITRQVIEKVIFHELGQTPVKDYMNTEMEQVSPEAELLEVQEKIITNKQRILPVVEDEVILGVITRTDLLNILVQQSRMALNNTADPFKSPMHARTRNIIHFMRERLPDRIIQLLRQAGQTAAQLAFDAYVVGGFVRDLFLYRPNEDLDIVIEGDGIAFAQALAAQSNARIHTHKKFGTAVVIFPDGFKIDIATARLEYYRSPAALPDVEMSSIKLDLFRRDFTINTLAIHLGPEKFGQLIDFFAAQKDLKDKVIRVLHNLSFVEDPTRIFRAIRFEQRFGFSIGKLTSSLIQNAVRMDFFKRLSGRRMFTEIRLILEEQNPAPAIARMHDYNLLQAIHPSIELKDELIQQLNAVTSTLAWHDLLFTEESYSRWAVYFMVLIRSFDLPTSFEICQRLELAPRHTQLLCSERLQAQEHLSQMEYRLPQTAAKLYHHLNSFRTELILYMMAVTERKSVKKAISAYYNQLRTIQTAIGGEDLKALGLKPGPLFREILDAVRDARLNGKLQTREDELRMVQEWIAKIPNKALDSRESSR
jgi:tRNA nucleotidyltransferase (CCA-adding enzyme)